MERFVAELQVIQGGDCSFATSIALGAFYLINEKHFSMRRYLIIFLKFCQAE